MTNDAAFESVLLCRDPELYCLIERALKDLPIHTTPYFSSSKVLESLTTSTVDLVAIELDNEESSTLVQDIWGLGIKRKPTILAVSGQMAHVPGVHVLVQRPISPQKITPAFEKAYSLMLYDYRRRARYPLMTPVMAADQQGRTVALIVTDISDGGVGLRLRERVPVGQVFSFRLWLPGAPKEIYAQVRVVWALDYGTAGCEFVSVPPVDAEIVHDWLIKRCPFKVAVAAVTY